MNEFYNKHYITLDANNLVIGGFSDAFREPTNADTLLTDKGGYQFRLFPNGEENPALTDMLGVPFYRYADGAVVRRSDEELAADRDPILAKRAREAQINVFKARLAATDYAVIKIAEGAATTEEYASLIADRQAWRREINALEEEE